MIGIIGAMDGEVAALKEKMKVKSVIGKASMKFCIGKIHGKDVVVVKSGIGKVNAAACAQILIDSIGVSAIINTGIAGGLHDKVNIGDIVISTDALQHDVDARPFGYDWGQIPQMDVLSFRADKKLVELAEEICALAAYPAVKGRIVSGDQFIADCDTRREIFNQFKGYCTEMEGAAIAQICYLNHIPFVIIRTISDKADASANADLANFEVTAIEKSAKITEGIIEKYEVMMA